MNEQISVIIPTLNEEQVIAATLRYILKDPLVNEVIVVDGGSKDSTLEIVAAFQKVRLLHASKGRAIQMNVGAEAARGDILFFLHADTIVPLGACERIRESLNQKSVVGGSFYLEFQEENKVLSLIAGFTRINLAISTFGDQGLWLRRETFFAIGGYPEVPIMEDVEIQYPLRAMGQFVKLDMPLVSSARRFLKNGILYQIWLDTCILTAYLFGVPPEVLAKWYR